jgi:hypothetical protein
VRAEFTLPDAPDEVIGAASWDGHAVRLDDVQTAHRDAIARIFRPIPVVVDDRALRGAGSEGPVLLEPGDLRWFIAAATTGAQQEGLAVRLVTAAAAAIGWDPAGAYRTFARSVERRNGIAAPRV